MHLLLRESAVWVLHHIAFFPHQNNYFYYWYYYFVLFGFLAILFCT